MELKSEPFTLKEAMRKIFHFKVPPYQRNYSWKRSQIQELLNDMDCIYDKEINYHFIGFVISTTKKDDNDNIICNVIDGQQRIATFTMILSVLRDLLFENDKLDEANFIQHDYLFKVNPNQISERQPIITMNDNDDELFQKLVIEFPSEKLTNNTVERDRIWKDFKKEQMATCKILCDKESEKKLMSVRKEIIKHFKNRIKEYNGDYNTKTSESRFENSKILIKYRNIVYDKFRFILAETDTIESAYTIFETLNDRGVSLSLSDLLKNYIFQKAHDKSQELYNRIYKNWRDISNIVDPVHLTDLMRYYWISQHEKVSAKNLYKKIKEYLENNGNDVESFVKIIRTESRYYSKILDHQGLENYKNQKLMKALNILNIKQAYPILLSVMNTNIDELPDYLELLVNFSFRYYTICNKNPRVLEDFWANSALAIRKGNLSFSEFKDKMLSYYPKDGSKEDDGFIGNFLIYKTKNHKIAKYILEEINNFILRKDKNKPLNELKMNPETSEITLEHILPRTIDDDSDWCKIFADNGDFIEYVNKLGNMTLLIKPDNSINSNDEFDKKNEIFKLSKIPTTKNISKNKQWTKEEIDANQSELVKIAKEIWKI